VWYHLSKESDGEVIVTSRENDPRKPGHWSPKPIDPTRGYREDDTWRLCVCKTVGQCVVAVPDEDGTFCVYRVRMPETGPGAPVPGRVKDHFLTRENCIIDSVVEANENGRILIERLGYFQISRPVTMNIKGRLWRKEYPLTAGKEEQEKIWDVVDGQWIYTPYRECFSYDERVEYEKVLSKEVRL